MNVKPESADFVDDVEAAGGCEDTVPPPPPPPPREKAGFGAEAEEGDGTAGAAGPATKSQQEYKAQQRVLKLLSFMMYYPKARLKD